MTTFDMHYGNRGTLGQAINFNPDNDNNGLWIEGSDFDNGESAGVFMNGNTLVAWSPGDNQLVRIYDEDDLPNGSPKVTISNNGDVSITGTLSQGSSIELKDNITTLSIQEALEVLENLNPVKFTYKGDKNQETHTGFIAEDSPELVKSLDGKSICVTDVIGILTKIIKEQQESINTLVKKVKNLNV
ncbi:MAG: tail fiber domain-containing protein [Waterburya sp.]